ncbi:MAG: hypothetical protein LBF86_06130 [Helicobacteraceae bacterium]|jgi:hypothetical protein|nr:hypothetical protein [Helicobacteraceae bacterium]
MERIQSSGHKLQGFSGDGYRIKDVRQVWGFIIVPVVFFFAGFVFFAMPAIEKGMIGKIDITGITICLFFAAFSVLIARARLSGVILYLRDDILEFPGGGIAANNILDYFRPSFLLQAFKRSRVRISEIRDITRYDKIYKSANKNTVYYIKFNGNFGAANINFITEGKRDELYSILTEINGMGTPIVIRGI